MIPDLYISHRAIPAAQAAADADTTYFQLICVSARFTIKPQPLPKQTFDMRDCRQPFLRILPPPDLLCDLLDTLICAFDDLPVFFHAFFQQLVVADGIRHFYLYASENLCAILL